LSHNVARGLHFRERGGEAGIWIGQAPKSNSE
jgi:hypothetical protein